MAGKRTNATTTASRISQLVALGIGIGCWGCLPSAGTADDQRFTPESRNDASGNEGDTFAAPYVGYHPFKPATTNAMGKKPVSGAADEVTERRGKGLTRSEVQVEPGRTREYLWEPYLFRDSPTYVERTAPNISLPGADTANFPNSAFTLPAGRFYFENSPVGYFTGTQISPAQYNWELFYRYGVTDNLEFRLYTGGFTVAGGSPTVAGFSPITFDVKYNLWEENPDYWIPAVGVETYVQTTWGTDSLNDGTQAAWSINVDHTLPFGIAFEWNIGTTQIFGPGGRNFIEENAAWSLQRDLTEDVSLFIHGYHNAAGLPRGPLSNLDATNGFHRINGRVYGIGAVWTMNDRIQIFGSVNGGTGTAPGFIGLGGFALAF